ncbi:hypothetical protein EV182_002451, partial [Spiromyces aspiralis]
VFEREIQADQSEYVTSLLVRMLRLLTGLRFIERYGGTPEELLVQKRLVPVKPTTSKPAANGKESVRDGEGESTQTNGQLKDGDGGMAAIEEEKDEARAGMKEIDAPVDYFSLSVRQRLHVLSNLCDWCLINVDQFVASIKTEYESPCEWRIESIGTDAYGRRYWFFKDDLTLYREIPASKVERVHKVQGPGRSRPDLAVVQMRSSRRVSARLVAKEKASVAANTVDSGQPVLELDPALLALEREENGDIWEPVCLTINEWEIFPDQLAGSPNTYQRRLHGKLINTIQPDVLRELKEIERKRRLEEAVVYRKRSSRLLMKEIAEQQEQEERERREREERRQNELERQQQLYTALKPEGKPNQPPETLMSARERRALERQYKKQIEIAKQQGEGDENGRNEEVVDIVGGQEPVMDDDTGARADTGVGKEALPGGRALRQRQATVSAEKSDHSDSTLEYSWERTSRKRQRESGASLSGNQANNYGSSPRNEKRRRGRKPGIKRMLPKAPATAVPVRQLYKNPEGGEDYEEDWMFDCLCGHRGMNLDDGRTMTMCERCHIWQHLACAMRGEEQRVGRKFSEQEWDQLEFVCLRCIRTQEQQQQQQRTDYDGIDNSGTSKLQ